jgi:hypothetical protein
MSDPSARPCTLLISTDGLELAPVAEIKKNLEHGRNFFFFFFFFLLVVFAQQLHSRLGRFALLYYLACLCLLFWGSVEQTTCFFCFWFLVFFFFFFFFFFCKIITGNIVKKRV